jgi:cell division protein ZapA
MPQVDITIGGRQFEVACQPGEEPFLRSAAGMLDAEATTLSEQIGRMPESRMLLMAGLLLADRTAALEDRLREAEARMAELEAEVERRPQTVEVPVEVPVEVRVEVPVIPLEVRQLFVDVAEETEALAHAVASLVPERMATA